MLKLGKFYRAVDLVVQILSIYGHNYNYGVVLQVGDYFYSVSNGGKTKLSELLIYNITLNISLQKEDQRLSKAIVTQSSGIEITVALLFILSGRFISNLKLLN